MVHYDVDKDDFYFDGYSAYFKSDRDLGEHRVIPHTGRGRRIFQKQLDSLRQLMGDK